MGRSSPDDGRAVRCDLYSNGTGMPLILHVGDFSWPYLVSSLHSIVFQLWFMFPDEVSILLIQLVVIPVRDVT